MCFHRIVFLSFLLFRWIQQRALSLSLLPLFLSSLLVLLFCDVLRNGRSCSSQSFVVGEGAIAGCVCSPRIFMHKILLPFPLLNIIQCD